MHELGGMRGGCWNAMHDRPTSEAQVRRPAGESCTPLPRMLHAQSQARDAWPVPPLCSLAVGTRHQPGPAIPDFEHREALLRASMAALAVASGSRVGAILVFSVHYSSAWGFWKCACGILDSSTGVQAYRRRAAPLVRLSRRFGARRCRTRAVPPAAAVRHSGSQA